VLEVNPRPPASLALYAHRGAIEAQVAACRDAAWDVPAPDASRPVRGTRIVYAARSAILDEPAAQRLASRDHMHDLPSAGARFDAGDPVCSVSAAGDDAAQVSSMLKARHDDVIQMLESLS